MDLATFEMGLKMGFGWEAGPLAVETAEGRRMGPALDVAVDMRNCAPWSSVQRLGQHATGVSDVPSQCARS